MRLTKSLGMIPLVISLSSPAQSIKQTDVSFDKSDINEALMSIDPNLYSHLGDTKQLVNQSAYVKPKFKKYLENWKRETFFSSRLDQIVGNRNFKNIVELGENAIPFILAEVHQKPSNLIWALNAILNRTISQENITVTEACKAWVRWGLRNRIISENDLLVLA